jgi:broad specificity phosphatase PhoE
MRGVIIGAAAGAGLVVLWRLLREDPVLALARARRRRLPRRIILVRHGESEGNTDVSLYRDKADNLIELTAKGAEQAQAAGRRIRGLLRTGDSVALHVSPFARTLETARRLRDELPDAAVRFCHITPLIREQEFGNLQGDDFATYRAEQQRVGRFFYRFPTGESGSDVYGR